MRNIGKYESEYMGQKTEYYYPQWGYEPGSLEFEKLFEGQVFEFHDQVFGTEYKLTKSNGKWKEITFVFIYH